MEVHVLTVSPAFMVNCYIVACKETKEAIIIDAGDEADRILDVLDEKQLKLKFLINTHAHIDHICAVSEIQDEKKVPFYLHEKEKPVLDNVPVMAKMYGFEADELPKINRFIDVDKTYMFGNCALTVIETPGHSPGGVCFQINDHLFSGDTLFCGGIGRTDIPGGIHNQLVNSIMTKLFPLDQDTVVLPGHGPVTTIGQERASNPFLKS